MNTKNMTQEQISALIDNELADEQIDAVVAGLHQAGGRAAWDIYHQIGDVMRSDEMSHAFSADFTARIMARLDAEPAIVAPKIKPILAEQPTLAISGAGPKESGVLFKRYAMPTAAVAAIALVLIAGPQLRTAMKGNVGTDTMAPIMVVSQAHPASPYATVGTASSQNMNAGATGVEGVILRDPRIDEYLLAHQRFSPSLYSTAQYARSATFALDSDK